MPIVLIHGFPFNSEMWKGQTQMLQDNKKHLRIITYDLRGHGKSDVGDGQYTIELFVDDFIALLDYLKLTKAILCGFSMGGYIALRAIERNPDRFSALVLCDTMSAADSTEAKVRRANTIKQIKREGVERFAEGFLKAVFAPQTFDAKPDIIDEIKRTILSNSPLGICGALLAMAGRTDTTEGLSKINVPTLVLVGEHDAVTPPSAAKTMHERIPNSKLYLIDNAGHMSNLENPNVFDEHLTKFLEGID
ncbi:MAG: alpha/beta fold hydrolase [Nitrososphaera sp.]